VGLSLRSEDIDAFAVLPDGSLLVTMRNLGSAGLQALPPVGHTWK
jgi:hypothetical protein